MQINHQNYVDEAEKAILSLKDLKHPRTGRALPMVNATKVRNLLIMATDIYNDVLILNGDKLTTDMNSRIEYMRVRFMYEAGRDPVMMKNFLEMAGLLEFLRVINGSKKNYLLFHRYLEALAAFHKFYGGKD